MTPEPLSDKELAKLRHVLETAQRGDYLDNAFSWHDIEQLFATIAHIQSQRVTVDREAVARAVHRVFCEWPKSIDQEAECVIREQVVEAIAALPGLTEGWRPSLDDIATEIWGTRVEIADFWAKPGQSGEINRGSAEMLAAKVLRLFDKSAPPPTEE